MIQPPEMKLDLPMDLSSGAVSTTTKVWDMLTSSCKGDLEKVKRLVNDCPELIYAQYNYTPPIHFAVREGHTDLVKYLLDNGAHDPDYKIYPFRESLLNIAQDREHHEIVLLLEEYNSHPERCKFRVDNGRIHYHRTSLQHEFEQAVDKNNLERVRQILKEHPEFASDNTFFWGEGILTRPVKDGYFELAELLISYGATVPSILKWTQAYYFETYTNAVFIMERGMNPNTMSWHQVTILHDMAQKGNIPKAELLLKRGAAIDPVDEEYQSTPLGMAARWGHAEMVEYLIKQGADLHKAGASWSTPLVWARKKGHEEIEEMLLDAGAR